MPVELAVGDILIGAAVGAVGSIVTGGDPLKGALFGAVTGGVAGAFSGGAESSLASGVGGDAGDVAASLSAAPGGTTAVGNLGSNIADSATKSLAKGLINNVAQTPENPSVPNYANQAVTDSSQYNTAAGGGPDYIAQGSEGVGTPGSNANLGLGSTSASPAYGGNPAATDPGMWEGFKKWATDPKNELVVSRVMQAGGTAVAGMANAVGGYMTMEKKAELELKNKEALIEYYKNFVQGGSQGGTGVKLGMTPIYGPAKKPGGGLIYGTNGLS